MLHEFLADHRVELIQLCRSSVADRAEPKVTDAELEHGIPLFLEQLITTLRVERAMDDEGDAAAPDPSGNASPTAPDIGMSAARHGGESMHYGFTLDQLVHGYGDLCQAITATAYEHGAPIQVDEFRTLNRCLDNAIADAVTEFAYQRDLSVGHAQLQTFNERLGALAHELRDLLHTATLVVSVLKAGKAGFAGATGAVLDRSLISMRNLIDRSLADVRVTAGLPARPQVISVSDFVAEVRSAGALEAENRGCLLTVCVVDADLAVLGDRDMLFSAVANLLQNAFKFTKRGTEVSLTAYASADRIRIDVADHCGGLPAGGAERMFLPFTQCGQERSGIGLGLTICRRSVEANSGILSVRDVPGSGCVFTIDLPRHPSA